MVRTEIVEPNAVFCPEGITPLFALPGYYTIGQTKTTRYDQVACPVGAYCVNGVIHDVPRVAMAWPVGWTAPTALGRAPRATTAPQAACTVKRFPAPSAGTGPLRG